MQGNSFKMVKTDESIQNLLIKLAETPDLLSKKELTRLAKFMNKPINSYENFYMTNQNYGYIHLDLKNSELRLFILLADLLTSGTEVKSYKNNKPIKADKQLGLCEKHFSDICLGVILDSILTS